MKRRNFILLASTGAVLASLPVAKHYFYDTPEYDQNLAIPESLSLIWDDATILSIGAKYREKFSEEKSERALARALFEISTNRDKTRLEGMNLADFSEGRTVVIDGWVLSKTEARQCALHHVLTQKKV